MWNELCGCIDENWKALKARIQASITGIKLNGTTYYQTDGTGICDLGDIQTEIPKASEIELDDGRDVQTAIVAIDDAMPDKVNDVEPVAVTDGINLNETDGNGTTARMLIRADDSLKFDGLQVGISDKTDGRITEALNTATTAGNKADDAQADADSAMSAATTANTTANTALTKAETAIENAATAQATATTAQATAETAVSDASTAQTTADTANATANSALSKATTANDTANTAKNTADTANATATNAQATASTAKSTADTAITNAQTAQNTADTAVANAQTAQNTADTAITNAKTAQDTADSAQSTANTASSTASTAYQTAVTAKTTAETADGVADEAKTTADSALTKAKNAIVSFVTSVTDKVLNATVTKGDDSTETVPLFTAGNNLSWNGKTLNAVGGAAYSAGDGITLADGAFSVNAGTGLQINATDNSLEVSDWEELSLTDLPTDFEYSDRLKILFRVWPSATMTAWTTAPTSPIFKSIPDPMVCIFHEISGLAQTNSSAGKFPMTPISASITSYGACFITIAAIYSATNWNNTTDTSARLIQLNISAFNAGGMIGSSIYVTRDNISTYISRIERKKTA